MTDKENTYVGIDMSGSQTRCLVAASEGSVLRYVSCGSMPPARWNADDQREQQLTQESVLEAVCEAENEGGLTVLSAVVGVGGAQVHSYLVHSSVAVPRGRQTVQAADVAKVVRKAANGATSPGSTVLQVVPMEFVAGARPGLSNPVGYPAHRLEAYVRVIFTPQAEHDHANWLVNQASVRVDETLVPGFASAYGTLVEAERARGVAHLDIGKTSSSLTAYRGGLLRLASGLPIGRDHLMNDVSRAFGTDPRVATSLISDFGSAVYRDEFSRVYVFVPSEGPSRRTSQGRVWARDMLDKIIALRIEECMTLALDELRHEGLADGAVRSLVVTGDIADLPGVREMAQTVLGLRTRIGAPSRPEGLPEALRSPGWACAAGLVLYAHRLARRSEQVFENQYHAAMREEEQAA